MSGDSNLDILQFEHNSITAVSRKLIPFLLFATNNKTNAENTY